MTQNTQYHNMAKQFLDMWQEQGRGMMNDDRFLSAMLDTLQNMQPNFENFSGNSYGTRSSKNQPFTASPFDSASAASDVSGDELAELHSRLGECEDRIAKLEAALRAKKRAAKPVAKSAKQPVKKPATKSTKKSPVVKPSRTSGGRSATRTGSKA